LGLSIAQYKDKVAFARGQLTLYTSQLRTAQEELSYQEKRLALIAQAQELIQAVSTRTQSQLKIHIEEIVNLCLHTCFSDRYTFKLEFVARRNRTEADIVLMRDGVPADPIMSSGGGLCDILSLGLRMASWSLGKTQNVICLDEALKYLSPSLHKQAGLILRRIAEELKLQVIFVTHSPIIYEYGDTQFYVKNENGVSTISTQED
jgi:DNA repair exonuclease SbcCD ATPase subunit